MLLSFILLIILLVLVIFFLAITVLLIPKIVVKWAPKDIQEIILKRPDEPLWKNILGILIAIIIIINIIGILVYAGYNAIENNFSFIEIFSRYIILLEGYKIFDMIFFDWILLTKLNIFQKLFPETIGCKGYEQFGFNLKSQIIKLIIFMLISLLIAICLSKI